MKILDGKRRVVIEDVQPEINAGRFPIKHVIGQSVEVEVEADAFTDSHDALACVLRYRHASETDWREVAMSPFGNDRWRASFPITEIGYYIYTLTAWIDHFFSWQYKFLRRWALDRADSLKDFIARVNRIRRESPALQQDYSLQFFDVNNDSLLCYAKTTPDNAEIILVVANLDPHHIQSCWITLPPDSLGLDVDRSYQVQDLLTSARFLWNGPRNYVEINPQVAPAHIFKLRRRVRTEHDFDYFL